MKFVTIYIGDSKVELYNTLLGKEMLIVDGQKITEKFSFAGTNHRFTIRENGQEKHCELNTKLSVNGAIFDLFVDNKPVIEAAENNVVLWLFLIAFILLSARAI